MINNWILNEMPKEAEGVDFAPIYANVDTLNIIVTYTREELNSGKKLAIPKTPRYYWKKDVKGQKVYLNSLEKDSYLSDNDGDIVLKAFGGFLKKGNEMMYISKKEYNKLVEENNLLKDMAAKQKETLTKKDIQINNLKEAVQFDRALNEEMTLIIENLNSVTRALRAGRKAVENKFFKSKKLLALIDTILDTPPCNKIHIVNNPYLMIEKEKE